MYHTIGVEELPETGAKRYSVMPTSFQAQMEIVSKHNDILLTFDDGDITNYSQALPVLKSLGLKAHFFIIPARVGTKGYMGWQEIKALQKANMSIGAHGMTHRILTMLSDVELWQELKGSKCALEESLGGTISDLSIPRGIYDTRVITMARKAGFTRVFTSDWTNVDGYCLGRIAVMSYWGLEHFRYVVERGLTPTGKFCRGIKDAAKVILGGRDYDRLRNYILRH